MKSFLLFSLFLASSYAFSQEKKKSHPEDFILYFGKSKHYSGDIGGLMFSTEYSKYLKQRLSLSLGIGGTIHDGSSPLFFTDMNGNLVDGSIRFTVAGVQAHGLIGYNFLNNKIHELKLNLGVLFRYQSSSLYDVLTIYYPPITGLPIPVVVFNNVEPQRTYAAGIIGRISYSYLLNNNIIIGALAGYQFDTNGDNISQLLLGIGYRFQK